jgi:hypothetical protein
VSRLHTQSLGAITMRLIPTNIVNMYQKKSARSRFLQGRARWPDSEYDSLHRNQPRCVLILSHDVRTEGGSVALVRFILGDTGYLMTGNIETKQENRQFTVTVGGIRPTFVGSRS